MKALRGLSKADTLKLVEIEKFVETGKRADGLQVTDEWIDEALKFMARELRPTLESWAEMGDQSTEDTLTVLQAKKLYRVWKKGVKGKQLRLHFEELGRIVTKKKAP